MKAWGRFTYGDENMLLLFTVLSDEWWSLLPHLTLILNVTPPEIKGM